MSKVFAVASSTGGTQALATIWLTNRLGLPDADDILNPHLYDKLPKGALAGMAIY